MLMKRLYSAFREIHHR